MRPDRPVDTSDRAARSTVVGSGSGTTATVTRVGSAIIQKSGAPLRTHEHALSAATSGALLGVSLLGARFPRVVAWPLVASSVGWASYAPHARRSSMARQAFLLLQGVKPSKVGKTTNSEEGSVR